MSEAGRASYAASKAKAAAGVRGYVPASSGAGGGTAKAEYFVNKYTGKIQYWVGGGEPPGSGWESVGSQQPAGYVGGQARGVATTVDKKLAELTGGTKAQQLTKEGAYYYNPITRVIAKQERGGYGKAMTKTEAEYLQREYVSKGLSPFLREGKQMTVSEHKGLYEEELRARKDTEKFPYRMDIGGQQIKISSGMAGKFKAAGLMEIIKTGEPKEIVTVYRKDEKVTYRVGEHTPLKGWNVEAVTKGTAPVITKAKIYEPTAWGGMQLAWAKSKEIGKEVVSKAKEKYAAYTPPGLLPATKAVINLNKQLGKTFMFEEAGEKAKKIKEITLVKGKEIIKFSKEGYEFAWTKIKAYTPKVVKDIWTEKKEQWNTQGKDVENMFLKARGGYIFAEEKAKEWKPQPIVKQPAFLKGIDPYKEFREQTKGQVIGATQASKVTMGVMVGITEDIRKKPYKLPLYFVVGAGVGKFVTPALAGTPTVSKMLGYGLGGAWAVGVGVEAMSIPAGLGREKFVGVKAAETIAFIAGAKYGWSTTKEGKATNFLKELAKEEPPSTKIKQYYRWEETKFDITSPKEITYKDWRGDIKVTVPSDFVSSKYRVDIPEGTVSVAKSYGSYDTINFFGATAKGVQYSTISKEGFFVRSITEGGITTSKVYQGDILLKTLEYSTKPIVLPTEPFEHIKSKDVLSMPEYRFDINKGISSSKLISIEKTKGISSWTEGYVPYGTGKILVLNKFEAFTEKISEFPFLKYKTTGEYGKPKLTISKGVKLNIPLEKLKIYETRYIPVEYMPKPENIKITKTEHGVKIERPVVSKTIQKAWVNQEYTLDWAKPIEYAYIKGIQENIYSAEKKPVKLTQAEKDYFGKIEKRLDIFNRQQAREYRGERLKLFKESVSSKVKTYTKTVGDMLTKQTLKKAIKPVEYTSTIPNTATIKSSMKFAPMSTVGLIGLTELGEKLEESNAEKYVVKEKQEYKQKSKQIIKSKLNLMPVSKLELRNKLIEKQRLNQMQSLRQTQRLIQLQKLTQVTKLNIAIPDIRVIEIPKTKERLNSFGLKLSFEGPKQKGKQKQSIFPWATKYVPSVQAEVFKIKGRKPSGASIGSGLMLRPILARR